jgi:hypothetical protein
MLKRKQEVGGVGRVRRLVGVLYEGCGSSSLALRPFPEGLFHALILVVLPLSYVVIFVLAKGGAVSTHPAAASAPLVAKTGAALSYVLVIGLVVDRIGLRKLRRNAKRVRIALATIGYFTLAFAFGWGYGDVLNAALRSEDSSAMGLFGSLVTYGGTLPPLLVAQVQMAFIAIAVATSLPSPGLSKTAGWLAAVAVLAITACSFFLATRNDPRHVGSLLFAVPPGAVLAASTVALSFHIRSGQFGRAMSDATAGLLGVIVLNFYYSQHPGALLLGSMPFLGVLGVVLWMDNPINPRRRGFGSE